MLELRAAVDLVAMGVLTLCLFLPRHHRRDLVTVFWLLNASVFSLLMVIGTGAMSVGAGLGLFGVLSIVRLRSEQYRNVDIGYFFVALSLALVTALAPDITLVAGLSAGMLVIVLIIDASWFLPSSRHVEIVLDRVFEDDDELRAELNARLGAPVSAVTVTSIDYVRLTMLLSVSLHSPRVETGALLRVRNWAGQR